VRKTGAKNMGNWVRSLGARRATRDRNGVGYWVGRQAHDKTLSIKKIALPNKKNDFFVISFILHSLLTTFVSFMTNNVKYEEK
jgi:hypothetical protein